MEGKIGAYARISLDTDGDYLGVTRQHKDAQELATRRGWQIIETYTDNNISAFKRGVVRPEFERMIADLKSGHIQGFVTYDLDRLTRQPIDLERIIELYDNHTGLKFAAVTGLDDLNSEYGIYAARSMVNNANMSSRATSRRVKRKIQEQAENGVPHWSKRPFGYNRDGSLDPAESAIVRRMGEWFIQGSSTREIAWRLNEGKHFARGGRAWYSGNIRTLLMNPRFAAIRVHDGVEYPGKWTPIFTPEEWEKIKRMFKHRRDSYGGRPNNRRYLLTGLLVCSCGTHLRGMTKRDGKTKSTPDGRLRGTYQCPTNSETHRRLDSCAGTCVGSEPLEHFIKEAVIYRLDSPELAAYLSKGDSADERTPGLLAERDQWQKKLEDLADDYADMTLDKAAYKRSVSRVQARLSALDAELDSLRASRFKLDLSAGEAVRQAWESREDGWRRQLLEVLIEKIVINKSSMKPYYVFDGKKTRFDASRVSIEWRA